MDASRAPGWQLWSTIDLRRDDGVVAIPHISLSLRECGRFGYSFGHGNAVGVASMAW